MRDVINKNVTEEEVLRTCRTAFEGGFTNVKLYFMLGLPVDQLFRKVVHPQGGKRDIDRVRLGPGEHPVQQRFQLGIIACACFVPKPFTPFEFEPQDTMENLRRKQKILLETVRSRKINVKYHDSPTSFLEAVLARGDRRLCPMVEYAWRSGSKLDGWNDYFRMERWEDAAEVCGIDLAFYANRTRSYDAAW